MLPTGYESQRGTLGAEISAELSRSPRMVKAARLRICEINSGRFMVLIDEVTNPLRRLLKYFLS
jgi:hypothetical protein